MGRSLFFSSLLHIALLACLLLVFFRQSPTQTPPEQAQIIVRPLKVAKKPKLPQIVPGLAVEEAMPTSSQAHESSPAAAQKLSPSQAEAPPEPPAQAPRPKSRPLSPQLLLPEPNYPTRPSKERSMSAEDPDTGSGPVRAPGEDLGEDRPALPYYHPAVTLTGMSDRTFILVKFDIEANARFEVEILEGTGNIHLDARALHVLKRWKWLPMRINGENLASVEIVRLFRKDTPPSQARQ